VNDVANAAAGASASRAKQSLRVWLRMISTATRVENTLRGRLKARFGVTLPQFDVLSELERAGVPQTMGELSRRLVVSNGNVTGVVDRLVRDGLVRRQPSSVDRRVLYIELTRRGARRFARMAAEHERWVAELFDGLSDTDLQSLLELLKRTRGSVQHHLDQGAIS
jgi:DNA-binding MarR family transcriptional regulator